MTYPPQGFPPPAQPGFPPQPQGFPPPAQPAAPNPLPPYPPTQPGAGLPAFPQTAPAPALRSVDDWSRGGGKSISFGDHSNNYNNMMGRPYGGVVTATSVQQVTNFQTKQPEFWADNTPKEKLVITFDTAKGRYPMADPADPADNGVRSLHVQGAMVNQYKTAATAALPGRGIRPGDQLYGCFTGLNGRAYVHAFEIIPGDGGQGTQPPSPGPAEQAAQPMLPTEVNQQAYAQMATPAPPAPPAPPAGPTLPPEYAAAGWTLEQYKTHVLGMPSEPQPPAQTAPNPTPFVPGAPPFPGGQAPGGAAPSAGTVSPFQM